MIRVAKRDDIDNIMEIVTLSIHIMNDEGNIQWDSTYPQKEDFLDDINSKALFVLESESNIKGIICINQTEPDEYKDLIWSLKSKATVIHRMAISPKYRNQGIGSQLMAFAETIAKNTNTNYLKTDTYILNDKMNHMFQKFGFQKVGEMNFKGKPFKFNCYEKVLL